MFIRRFIIWTVMWCIVSFCTQSNYQNLQIFTTISCPYLEGNWDTPLHWASTSIRCPGRFLGNGKRFSLEIWIFDPLSITQTWKGQKDYADKAQCAGDEPGRLFEAGMCYSTILWREWCVIRHIGSLIFIQLFGIKPF